MEFNNNCDSENFVRVNEFNNEIHFNGTINQKSITNLIDILLNVQDKLLKKTNKLKRKISDIEKEKDKDKDKEKDDDFNFIKITVEPKPIKLFITSNGGSIYQVFSAIDTINSLQIPVHTICKGFCASAGTLLSLAGKKRFITENSYMLIHELRSGTWGKYTHLTESIENSKKLMDHIKSYYVKKTKISIEELEEQLKKDVIWNADMCLEKGLVDEIIKYN